MAITAPSAAPEAQTPDLMSDDMLPIAGAAALGLLALGGAGIAARRRKRRREAEEFDARQQALATLEDEPVMELGARDEVRKSIVIHINNRQVVIAGLAGPNFPKPAMSVVQENVRCRLLAEDEVRRTVVV